MKNKTGVYRSGSLNLAIRIVGTSNDKDWVGKILGDLPLPYQICMELEKYFAEIKEQDPDYEMDKRERNILNYFYHQVDQSVLRNIFVFNGQYDILTNDNENLEYGEKYIHLIEHEVENLI